jgi:hypothetical protein
VSNRSASEYFPFATLHLRSLAPSRTTLSSNNDRATEVRLSCCLCCDFASMPRRNTPKPRRNGQNLHSRDQPPLQVGAEPRARGLWPMGARPPTYINKKLLLGPALGVLDLTWKNLTIDNELMAALRVLGVYNDNAGCSSKWWCALARRWCLFYKVWWEKVVVVPRSSWCSPFLFPP